MKKTLIALILTATLAGCNNTTFSDVVGAGMMAVGGLVIGGAI